MRKLIKSISTYLFPKKTSAPLSIGSEKTILVIDDYVPYHDKSSGSKRLFELLKLFVEMDFKVIFLPDDGKLTQPYASELINLGIEVIHAANKKELLQKLNARKDAIKYAWISRPALNLKYQSLLNTNTRKIFDTVDLHYLRMLRQAESEQNKKLEKSALKTKSIELGLANNSSATITVTNTEKNTLNGEGVENVFVVPNIHYSSSNNSPVSFIDRTGLLFIGGYKHDPNIDAARWLVNEIMPKIWQKNPSIQLTLLGSDPTDELLGFQSPNIIVPGYIHDVAPYFNSNKIFIAPLRYGAGMKGKIGQSLEFGLPVISTDIGVEGMDLQNEKDVLVANTTTEFVDKVLHLYESEELWNRIRSNSIAAINQYAPDNVKQNLKILFETIDA
ncbi:MAG: glycosyltransferase [Flavobacterium sp.]|nr:MAG: glycosyltransferase [Flavobacterium sp.]